MVSKARLDLPEPDSPVKTIMASLGRSSETSFRLCSRAPRTTSRSATVFPSSAVFVQALFARFLVIWVLRSRDQCGSKAAPPMLSGGYDILLGLNRTQYDGQPPRPTWITAGTADRFPSLPAPAQAVGRPGRR